MKGRRDIKSGEAFLLNLPGNISVWGKQGSPHVQIR